MLIPLDRRDTVAEPTVALALCAQLLHAPQVFGDLIYLVAHCASLRQARPASLQHMLAQFG
jgi:hypothetical protein